MQAGLTRVRARDCLQLMAKSHEPAAFHLSWSGTNYPIYVDPPSGGAPSDAKEPWIVMLCMDGDDQFADLCKARKVLTKTHALPPLLLVGVGYGASYSKPGNDRVRDYTQVSTEEAKRGGGADPFLGFLRDVLWPELTARYLVHPTIRGLAGYSLGALFALHALFKPEPFFNRVLAASPSIWWGERALLGTVAELQNQDVALPAKVFLSVGLKDSKSMTGDLDLLEAQLAARPVRELDVTSERFAECNHFNAIAVSFRTGLAALFNDGSAARE